MVRSHDRYNRAAAAHLPWAMEGQERLDRLADLSGHWQVDLTERRLQLGDEAFRITIIGSAAHEAGTWMWAWANPSVGPDHPAAAGTLDLRDRVGPEWGLWEMQDDAFPLEGVADHLGVGRGATIAIVACRALGLPAFYAGDYGEGIAYLGVDDDRLRKPPSGVTFPRFMSQAAEAAPGHVAEQALTYASCHDLPAREDGRRVEVDFPDGRMVVEADDEGRLARVAGSLGGASGTAE